MISSNATSWSEPRATLARWEGRLELHFEKRGARSCITRRRHQGPLLVQRAFPQPDGSCHAYLLHPPGGVVGGDRLHLDAVAGEGSHALLTTPAATKAYKSLRDTSELVQTFRVQSRALLEWLPQETIVYDGARLSASTEVDLTGSAQFAGWEVVCLGRNELGFNRGELSQRLVIKREGRPLLCERGVFAGGSSALQAPWGLAGRPVFGCFVKTAGTAQQVEAVRELIPEGDDWFSVTLLGEVLVCRHLGYTAEAAKRFFGAAWARLHLSATGRAPEPPRVWAT